MATERTKADLKALKEEQRLIKEINKERKEILITLNKACLLYTSDAADE